MVTNVDNGFEKIIQGIENDFDKSYFTPLHAMDLYMKKLKNMWWSISLIGGLSQVSELYHSTLNLGSGNTIDTKPGVKYGCQIHYISRGGIVNGSGVGHYVCSHLINNETLVVYESDKNCNPSDIFVTIQNQIMLIYPHIDYKNIEKKVKTVCDQNNTQLCGQIAAATAYFVCLSITDSITKLPLDLASISRQFSWIVLNDQSVIHFDLTGPIEKDKYSAIRYYFDIYQNSQQGNKDNDTSEKRDSDVLSNKKKIDASRIKAFQGRIKRQLKLREFRQKRKLLLRLLYDEQRRQERDQILKGISDSKTSDEDFEYYDYEDDIPLPDDDVEMVYEPNILPANPVKIITTTVNTSLFPNEKNNVKIKRVIHCLSEFINFTLYETIKRSVKQKLSSLLGISSPINYTVNVLPPVYVRARYDNDNIVGDYNAVSLRHYFSKLAKRRDMGSSNGDFKSLIAEFRNPITFSSKSTCNNSIKDYAMTKKYLEMEMLIRKAITKKASKFVDTIINKIFYNSSITIPNTLDWQTQMVKLSENYITKDSTHSVNLFSNLIDHHNAMLDEIYRYCFQGLVKMQSLNNTHIYIIDMARKLNKMASYVNFISKGSYNPLTMMFICLKRETFQYRPSLNKDDYLKLDTFTKFKEYLLKKRYSSKNINTIVDVDFSHEFNVYDLFLLFNSHEKGNSLNYTNPMNALILKDVAQDIVPIMVSELIFLTLLLHLGTLNEEILQNIDDKYKIVFERSGNCGSSSNNYDEDDIVGYTVLQSFPGLFTLICFWAKKYGKHDLGFLNTLDYYMTDKGGSRLQPERYKHLIKSVSLELSNICINILDSIKPFKLPQCMRSSHDQRQQTDNYKRLQMDTYVNYLMSSENSFLRTNTFA